MMQYVIWRGLLKPLHLHLFSKHTIYVQLESVELPTIYQDDFHYITYFLIFIFCNQRQKKTL